MTKKIIPFVFFALSLFSCVPTSHQTATTSLEGSQPIVADIVADSAIVVPAGYTYASNATFKILSWNVEHFVDPYDDPYIDNGGRTLRPQTWPSGGAY